MATVPILHFYRCPSCRGGRVTTFRAYRQRCGMCGSYLSFQESYLGTQDEWDTLRTSELYSLPQPLEPLPWTCVRCGLEITAERPKYRVDGKCCQACVTAELPERRGLLTQEEIALDRARRDAREHDDEQRMVDAYKALETKR